MAGEPVADEDEVTDVRWFGREELPAADLGPSCRATLWEIGRLPA